MNEDNKEIMMHAVPADHVTIVENPIIRANWIDKRFANGAHLTKCSNCGWDIITARGWRSYYCPYCGAIMSEHETN